MTDPTPELTPDDARAAGLDMWEASRQFTATLLAPHAGLATGIMIGGVVRCRSFLRAAYAAADAGYELEAMVLVRCMNEWAITVRWLTLDPDYHAALIAIADLSRRLCMDAEVRALPGGVPIMGPEAKARDEAQLTEYKESCGDRETKLPSLLRRAKAARLRWLYSLAYRADSQVAAHPTIWALDTFASVPSDGEGLIVHERPVRSTTSPYKAALVPLAIILDTFIQHAEDRKLEAALREIIERIPGGVGSWQALSDDEVETED